MTPIAKFFKLQEHGTTFQREILGGITTFLAMSYIIFVQPGVLAVSGMNFQAVLTATCLAAAVATVLMGLAANYPVALAPGMGENFFFAYTLCGAVPLGFGLTWQQALAAVLLAGIFFIAITLTGLRARIVNSIPHSLKCSIAAGIGLFITFIGLEYGGLVVASPGTLVRMGDLRQPVALATVAGLLLIVVLLELPRPRRNLDGDSRQHRDLRAHGFGALPGTVLDATPPGARHSGNSIWPAC